MGLSDIEAQQASATEETADASKQLLDYVDTYPNDRIIYCSISMILAAHADAGFHNESRVCSRAGVHISFLIMTLNPGEMDLSSQLHK